MGTEESRKVVLAYIEHMCNRQLAQALDLLSDDIDWWIVGKPHLYPQGGTKTKADIAEVFSFLDANLPDWVRMNLQNVIAENDRVAVEWELFATTKEGKSYQNNFLFIYVVKEGKIVQVREYFDLLHVNDVLFTSENIDDFPAAEVAA